MRLRKVKNAYEKLKESPYFISNPEKGKIKEQFEKKSIVHLEIGTGKGNFLIKMAKTYPEINFIGLEKYESVLVRAIEKLKEEEIPNLKFILKDAKELEEIFEKEINTIYLNFSDPWPKTRHAKRRLTSPEFLHVYDKLFENTKTIIQKTDNIGLFAYSIEELSKYGYTLEKVSLDLKNAKIPNIKTEYEEKFENLGFKINYLKAVKK